MQPKVFIFEEIRSIADTLFGFSDLWQLLCLVPSKMLFVTKFQRFANELPARWIIGPICPAEE